MPLHKNHPLFGRSIFSMLFLATINAGIVQAQITGDGTLPTRIQQIEMMRKITGGERVGNNLFHSFEEFSIPEGIEAIFENALDIQNIFTRITGSEISFIDGLLQTQGGANFFLVNPNGIVFGENAVIDVGGSFIATTANSIEFADGKTFNVRDEKPLLTWNAPIGLGLDGNNGSITVNGTGNQITKASSFAPVEFSQIPTRISAPDGQTLALVGKIINFNSGVVSTEGGDINLISVGSGSVEINQSENGLTVLDNGVIQYQDINLNQQSLVGTSGEKFGTVSLNGKNINLSNASFVLAQNQGNSSGGSIKIQASESLTLLGSSPDGEISSRIRSEILGTSRGKGTSIEISAHQLRLQDLGEIQTISFSNAVDAIGGDINIKEANNIKIDGAGIGSLTFGKGNAGNINLSASQLRINNKAVITSSTFGTGNGGKIDINADLLEIAGSGINREQRFQISSVSASSFSDGNAGNIEVTTQQLRIMDGASLSVAGAGNGNAGNLNINASESIEISGTKDGGQSTIRSSIRAARNTSTFGLPEVPTGDAGSLTINTPLLKVFGGGIVSVENQGTGSAGTLSINANNLSLDQAGTITAAAESGIGGNIELNTQNLNITNDSQITASAGGNENGGNITINTTNFTANNKNQITASAFEGDGGNIDINAADSLFLNDRDSISATSEAGEGGNITLNTEQLRLQNNSTISTSAGELGNGGNIEINTDTLLATNNSDITATAIRGNGGNITITADGILGIEERKATPGNGTSDIDASSEFGEDGTVTITNPQVFIQDPIVAMKEPKFDDLEPKFTGDCIGGRRLLTDSRHDNVPARPDELLGGNQYLPDPDFVPPPAQPKPEPNSSEDLIWKEGDPIASGNMIVATPDGKVLLLVKSQFESLRKRGCLPANIKILEEAANQSN